MPGHVPTFAACMLICCLLAGGCASRYGEQHTQVNYYPACYAPIRDLRDRENDVGRTTAGGAVVGALGGALVGLLATGGKWQGAMVGAAAGGATGAVAGNIYAKKRRVADDNMRLASYLQDIDGDISQMDVTAAAARASLQCYDRQFNALLTNIRAGKVTRSEAGARYAEISSGREEAIALLGSAASYGRDLDARYEQAFRQEEADLRAPARGAAGNRKEAGNQLAAARRRKQQLSTRAEALTREKASAEAESASQLNRLQSSLSDIRA